MKKLILVIAAMLTILPCSYGQFMGTWSTAMGNMAENPFGFQHDMSGYLAGNWFKNWDYIKSGGFGSINKFTRFQ